MSNYKFIVLNSYKYKIYNDQYLFGIKLIYVKCFVKMLMKRLNEQVLYFKYYSSLYLEYVFFLFRYVSGKYGNVWFYDG